MMTGVILAGGFNRRMGGRFKALLPVARETAVSSAIEGNVEHLQASHCRNQ